jgi:hypothetical protein
MTKQAELEARIEARIREGSVGQIWDRSIMPARTKRQMEAEVEELRQQCPDPDILDGFIRLVRQGRILNSGERKEGSIVWITPDALTPAG